MGKRSSKLAFPILIISALCSEVLLIERTFHFPVTPQTWNQARLHCQTYHTDLLTWDVISPSQLTDLMTGKAISAVWFGLHRDPTNVTVWRWINHRPGEGLSGEDVSQSSMWEGEAQSSDCAMIGVNRMWHSVLCSGRHDVYCSQGSRIRRHNSLRTWHEAVRFCQERCSNLATVTTANSHMFRRRGWIGLYLQAKDTWTWVGNSSSSYRNWAPQEPITRDCGSFTRSGGFNSNLCSRPLRFACYDDNLVVVNANKTWEMAVRHCRSLWQQCVYSGCKYSLMSVVRLQDFGYVRDLLYRSTTDEVWIGLRFLGGQWWWLNGRELHDEGRLPKCPANGTHCGTLSKRSTDNWIIRHCGEKRNFVCRKRPLQ